MRTFSAVFQRARDRRIQTGCSFPQFLGCQTGLSNMLVEHSSLRRPTCQCEPFYNIIDNGYVRVCKVNQDLLPQQEPFTHQDGDQVWRKGIMQLLLAFFQLQGSLKPFLHEGCTLLETNRARLMHQIQKQVPLGVPYVCNDVSRVTLVQGFLYKLTGFPWDANVHYFTLPIRATPLVNDNSA